MINKILLEKLIAHPKQSCKGAKGLIGDYANLHLTKQDVYDTKTEFKRLYPGLISQAQRYIKNPLYKPAYVEHVKKSHTPKVLIFDIETAPMIGYVWGRWNQNIALDQTVSEWFMICWSAKWLYTTDIMGDVLTPEEAKAQDDSRIVKHLWELVNEADIVIAYNGLKFDVPRMNTRFLACGLQPPKPYIVIDPIKTMKSRFALSSNKLDSLAILFGIDVKLHTDFELWKNCMYGDTEALSYMLKYNKKDVDILEEVYIRLRPWIVNHPNISNIMDKDICPFCGYEKDGIELDGFYYTGVNYYKLYRCPECGAVYRSRLPEKGYKPKCSTIVNH